MTNIDKEDAERALDALRSLIVLIIEDMHPRLVLRSDGYAASRLTDDFADLKSISKAMAIIEARSQPYL